MPRPVAVRVVAPVGAPAVAAEGVAVDQAAEDEAPVGAQAAVAADPVAQPGPRGQPVPVRHLAPPAHQGPQVRPERRGPAGAGARDAAVAEVGIADEALPDHLPPVASRMESTVAFDPIATIRLDDYLGAHLERVSPKSC